MSRHSLSFSIAAICVSLTVAVQSSLAQDQKVSAVTVRSQGYQLRAAAAEAIADGHTGNRHIDRLIAMLKAQGELRKAERDYAEVCLATGQSKFDAQSQRAILTTQQTSWLKTQARERAQARFEAAQARVRQVRQGEWPRALQNDVFRPLREELSAALGDRAFVAAAPSVDSEQTLSIVVQMGRQLKERREQVGSTDYFPAKRFLDDLKALTNEKASADPAL